MPGGCCSGLALRTVRVAFMLPSQRLCRAALRPGGCLPPHCLADPVTCIRNFTTLSHEETRYSRTLQATQQLINTNMLRTHERGILVWSKLLWALSTPTSCWGARTWHSSPTPARASHHLLLIGRQALRIAASALRRSEGSQFASSAVTQGRPACSNSECQ